MASQDFLNKAYLAYFGRPVDPVGAYAFKDSTEIEVYEAFFASPESQRLYGAEFGAEQINSIYQMHFGRDAEPAGLAHWLGMVETGRLTPTGVALAILQGAQGSDKVIIDNKLAASAKFTAALDTLVEADAYVGDAAAQYAREFLQSVGNQPKTQVQIDAAVASLVEIAEAGVIGKPNLFTLTENAIITEDVLADFEPIVKYVTYIGFNPHAHGETGVDNLDGNDPNGNDNNLTNETIPDGGVPLYDLDQYLNPVTYNSSGGPVFQTPPAGSAPAYVAQKGFFSYIRDLTGLDFVQLGLINVGDATGTLLAGLTGAITVGDQNGDGNNVSITVTAADGTVHTAEVDINNAYFKLLTNLIFDEESNLRLYEEQYLTYPTITVTKDANGNDLDQDYQVNVYKYVSEAGTKTIVPIVLTKYNNNGGTVEKGVNGQPYVTTTANDLIVAGRLELLHQAYIDAGEGVNTLEVDAKGYYAQPKALTNVQHIIVNNLPNVYNDASGDSTYPDLSGSSSYKNSVLDLNRAIDIETLTITESHFDGLQDSKQTTPGSLTVSGIRNGAEITLDGSFTQNVYLHLGEAQATGVDLVLNNVNFGSMSGYSNTPAQLVVAHNSPTLNIESTGGHNFIANGNLGAVNGYGSASGDGALTNLNISGDAKLHIDGNLDPSFHNATPATIDARANTAGVDLELTHDDEIVFYGTAAADDHFEAYSDRSITIAAGNGNGEFRAIADGDIVITAGNGNNEIYADSEGGDGDGIELEDTVTITVGNGQNDIQVLSEDAFTITAGDGNNRIKAALETVYEFGVTERDASVINVGNGQNEIDASASVLVVNAGNGGNDIDATGLAVTVNSGSGNDTIRVVDARSITINSTGADTITIGGSSQDYVPGNDGAQLSLTLGSGATVILGEYALQSNPTGETITAHPGSFITGTNLTLFIDTVVDLRAATLSGISRVVLDDDNLGFQNSPEANDTGNVDRALLTLTDTQVSQMAADGVQFSVQGGIFNTSAHIKIIVTQNLDVTTGAWATWLSSLPASIDLQFEIADGKQLTLTAQQLHTKVAQGGIMIADDGRTDEVSGKVYIKGAGLNFDPFNTSDQIRTTIEGREYVGGSLATGEFGFATDADTPADGIQRDEWGTNVKLDRTLTGYDRPAETPSYSRLTIDTDAQGGNIGPFQTIETFLRIIGEADMEFTPVKGAIDEWGAPITSGSAIALGVDLGDPANTFMVDFSSATGAITNLTLAHFQNADAMYGNGSASAPARVNVEIGGDLDNTAGTINDGRVGTSTAGLVSRGVQTYVVTDIDTEDDQAQFWTSRVTEDLQTLGLRGNYEKTITFGNTDRGVDFLLEVAYDKFDGYAVGNLVANFSRHEGATAVVNVVGLATLPANEVQKVASIVTDGNGLTINIEGGNTVIGSIGGANLDDVVLSTADNLVISTAMPLTGLESIDASAVQGDLSLALTANAIGAGFEFTAAAGTTTLALSGVTAGAHSSFSAEDAATFNIVVTGSANLSAATLENVDSIGLGAFGSTSGTVTLSAAQVADIGAGNIGPAHPGFTATVNVSGVGSTTFDSTAFIDGTTVNVTLASGAVVLATDTDLSNVNTFEVLENSEVTMSADQLVQLATSLAAAGNIAGFIADLATSKVNITGITQAHVDATFMLGAQEFSFTQMLEALSDRVESGTLTLAESVNLDASGSLNGFDFVLGDGMTLGLATAAQADGLNVEGGANTTINLLFGALGALTDINASGFNVDVLRFLDSLVVGQNVDAIFDGLLARVEKVIYNNYVSVIDQTVTISAGAVVGGNLSFDRTEDGLELQNFVLNLQGGTQIGGVDLGAAAPSADLVQTYLKTVTINSTGTLANPVTGETGNIMGSLTGGTAGANTENDLLDVTINASQDLAMTGVVFTNVGTDDEVATLTVTGTANVSIADLNTQDEDVDGLNVVHNGTGTLNVGIAQANIDDTDALSFTGTGDIVLTVSDTVDLSDDNLAAVTELVLADGATVTLTMAQGDAIGAANISSPGAANLNLEGLAGEPFAVANYGAGVDVDLVSLAALPVVTLNAATDLTGITGLVVPEGTVLNLTAAQFKQLTAGTIIGEGAPATTDFTVNITDLTQADVNSGFDLSGITANNLTVTLVGDVSLVNPLTITPAVTWDNDLNGADITIGANTFTLYSVALADALNITGTGVLKFTDTSFDSPADLIDASGFDVSELHMEAQLIAGQNVDAIFEGLAASITKVVTDEYGYVVGTTQVVEIQGGSTISGDIAFIKQEGDVEILDFTLTLGGGVNISGDVNLSKDDGDTLIPAYLQSVTIVSEGTAANVSNGETANVITGDLTPMAFGAGTQQNNLLDVTIEATQDLIIERSVVFNSVTEGDEADGVTANDIDDAVATLTVTGTADVTLGGIDTSDNDVDGANIVNNGTGTLSLTVNAASIDQDVAGNNVDALSFTGTGDIELTVVGTVDLSDDVLTAVTQITIAEDADLTLSQAQFNALGAANLVNGTTDAPSLNDETLTIVDFDPTVAFDATSLANGITLTSITLSVGGVLNPATNLTNVGSIIVPEGATLTLTAAQFQQLTGAGTITGLDADGNVSTDYTVNITGLTQADIDLDNDADGDYSDVGDGFKLGSVTADNINVSLGGSVVMGVLEDGALVANSAAVLGNASITMAAGQTLGLVNHGQADGRAITGAANTTVNFLFDINFGVNGEIEAEDYVGITTVRALATSVDGEDVELVIDNLASNITLNLYQSPIEVGFVSDINRVVIIEPGVQVPGFLAFNGQDGDRELRTLTITFEGDFTGDPLTDPNGDIEGAVIQGNLILDAFTPGMGLIADQFQTLTLISTGVGDSNGITGNITPLDTDGGGNRIDNTLLNVVINATADFTIGGTVTFNAVDAADNTATLTKSGAGDVSIGALNVADVDIDVLDIVANGGTLTITGLSPSIVATGTEEITFSGSSDIVLGTDETPLLPEDFADGIVGGGVLSSIDASGLTGDLSIENISGIDGDNFAFVSGTGVTTLYVSGSTLDAGAVGETGWSFDLSDAAAGSQLTFGTGLVWTAGDLSIDLGANAVLVITEDTDWTSLDIVNITGTIILAAGVDLELTAAQASGLTIITDTSIVMDEADPDFVLADVPTVTITKLGGAAYDFSDILVGAQSNIDVGTLRVFTATLEDNDVTINAAANLGEVAIALDDLPDLGAPNIDLAGQTIRFNTVAQAERAVFVDGGIDGARSTNVVWLFDNITAPVDTSDYTADIARLWVTEELITNEGGDVEQLFTTLPAAILRVDFTSVTALDVLLLSASVDRVVEFVHFTTLGNLSFNDVGLVPIEHVESLTLNLGGEVTLGNITLDNDLLATVDPDSVVFNDLTINSQRALHTDALLASEFFVNDNDGNDEALENVQPDAVNTVGNISVGANLDLLTVNINTFDVVDPDVDFGVQPTAGADLEVGTITYGVRTPDVPTVYTARLNLTGENDVNIASVVVTDADITGPVVLNTTGFSGTWTAPGASPAIVLGAQIQQLVFTNGSVEDAGALIGIVADGTDNANETLTVNFTLNGVASSVVVDLSAINTTDVAAVTAEVVAALSAIDGISASAVGNDVRIVGVGSNLVTVDTGTPGGTTNGLNYVVFNEAEVSGGTITLGTDTGPTANAGIYGPGLRNIDASQYGGTLNLGIVALIDGTNNDSTPLTPANDELTVAFRFTAGTGVTTATLGQDPDSSAVPTLAAGSQWVFDYTSAAPTSRLTITDDVVFTAPVLPATALPVLTLVNVDLYAQGDVDLTGVNLNVDANSDFFVPAGSTLTLTLGQYTALSALPGFEISGSGTVVLTGEIDTDGAVTLNLQAIRTVGVDLSQLTNAGVIVPQDNLVEISVNLNGAVDDDGEEVGYSIEGTDFDDEITGSNEDDTFNVTSGTDTIVGLTAEDPSAPGFDPATDEQDVLVVSSGATAQAEVTDFFYATAATVNNGTVTLTTDASGAEIDLTLAGGTGTFNVDGGAGADVIIGSARADVINGGNNGAGFDVLTGGLGADDFEFSIIQNDPTDPVLNALPNPALENGVDREQITITADGADEDDEFLVISYRINGTTAIPGTTVDLTAVDVMDADAVAAAVATHLSGIFGANATVSAATNVVTLVGADGVSIEILTVSDTGTTTTLAGVAAEAATADDVQVSTLTVEAGTNAGNYVAGDIISVTITLAEGASETINYTANLVDGLTPANVATGLTAAINAAMPGTTVNATVATDVITLTDEAGDNGGFTVTADAVGGVIGTGASALDPMDLTTVDRITDFVSGTDDIILFAAASGSNYDEDTTAQASFADAKALAETAFAAGDRFFFAVLEAAVEGTDGDDDGVLFFDANGDSVVDGAILLLGVTDLATGDIIAPVI